MYSETLEFIYSSICFLYMFDFYIKNYTVYLDIFLLFQYLSDPPHLPTYPALCSFPLLNKILEKQKSK